MASLGRAAAAAAAAALRRRLPRCSSSLPRSCRYLVTCTGQNAPLHKGALLRPHTEWQHLHRQLVSRVLSRGIATDEFPPHQEMAMPALSPTMTQGNVANWVIKEGDKINAGDVLAEIETDKATVEFDSQEDGYLAKILVPAGSKDIAVENADDVPKFKNYMASASTPASTDKAPSPKAQSEQSSKATPEKKSPKSPAKEYPPHQKMQMPALSPTMTQGNLGAWSKKEGDKINAGDVLAEVETDKATVDFDCQEDGYLAKILVASGTKDIPVGTLLAILAENEDDVAAFKDFTDESESQPDERYEAVLEESGDEQPSSSSSVSAPAQDYENYAGKIWPSVRRLLMNSNVSLSSIKGSGPHGEITKGDAMAAINKAKSAPNSSESSSPSQQQKEQLQQQQPEKPQQPSSSRPPAKSRAQPVPASDQGEFEDLPNSQIRKIIAQRLLESKQTIPHWYITADAELSALLALRKQLKEQQVSVSVNDFVIRAVALALRAVPEANVFWDVKAEETKPFSSVDVSVAVATDNGLITPIIKNADQKTLTAISAEMRDLATRARANKLKPHEFQGGTFTISNLGMYPVDYFSAIINPPQAGIMAVGKGHKAVVWRDMADGIGEPATVDRMTVTLSADNRAIDGEVAGRFLKTFSSLMSDPKQMLL
eukprot:jgi/Chlat1/2905/Chrsp2S04631